MKRLLICGMLVAMTAGAAEMKFPAHRMSEAELLAVLKENGLNDQVTACQTLEHKGTAAAVPALAALLNDGTQKALFQAARFALQTNPAPEAGAALKAALATVKEPARLAALRNSLKLRANPRPDGYEGAAEKVIAFPPKNAVQKGDLTVVPVLVEKAVGAADVEAGNARRMLVGFPNAAVEATLLELARGEDVKKARLAIGVLGDRRVRAAVPQLCAIAKSTKVQAVRVEAFKALASICDERDLPVLLELLKGFPGEERLSGAIVRVCTRAFVTDVAKVEVAKAEYGDFESKQVVNVLDMVRSLVAGGSRAIMASNRLAGHGGFAHDPAPGKVKQLRLAYSVNGGPVLHTITEESSELELVGCSLPTKTAKALVDATLAATGEYRAALAGIVKALDRRGCVPGADAVLFKPIFNGKDLAGWSQQDGYFSVKDGVIVGASTPAHLCKPNHHLVYTAEELADFELKLRFRLSRGANSGVQLRCKPQLVGDNGYQADMNGGGDIVGFVYHPRQHLVGERGAEVTLAADGKKTVRRFADGKELQKLYKVEQWNDMRVKVEGRTISVWINGVHTVTVNDAREEFFPSKGQIAFQLHQGPPMTVEFGDIQLKK